MHVRCAMSARFGQQVGATWVQYIHAKELAQFERSSRRSLTADRFIAVSSYTADLCARLGADPARTWIIPPAVHAAPALKMPHRWPGRRVLLSLSRLADTYKGHDTIIKALPAVVRRIPEVLWVVAGDGPLREDIEAEVVRRGLEKYVCFLGAVSDDTKAELFGEAEVFVLPSRIPPRDPGGEGFGIVFVEASAAGVPVIAARAGGVVDAVADGVTGLLVPPDDSAAFATALLSVLEDPVLRRRLQLAGPSWAARFDVSAMASALAQAFKKDGVPASFDSS